MNAIESLRTLSALAHTHRESIRKRTDTIEKASRLIAEYKAATGETSAHINDAIEWKAKFLAIRDLQHE